MDGLGQPGYVYSSVIIMGISVKKLHLEMNMIAINTSQSRNQGSGLEMEHLESGARRILPGPYVDQSNIEKVRLFQLVERHSYLT